MKISVIVPVYNVQSYLSECLDSIVKQIHNEIEIILINDGSTDKSKEICREYCQNFNNIIYIEKNNSGLSDTRNIGIEKSSGEYIIFIDSDDYWDINFFSGLNNIVEKNIKLDIVFFRFIKYYENDKRKDIENLDVDIEKINNKTGIQAIENILSKNKDFGWYACRYLVRRDYILENNIKFINNRSYEDSLWSPEVWLKASKVYYYDKAIYVYRLNREGQITSNVSVKNIEDSIFVSKYWLLEIEKYNIDVQLKNMILKNITVRYFYSIWFAWKLNDNHKKNIYKLIYENRELLKYKNSKKERITSAIMKLFGIKFTCNLLKYFYKFKKLL